MISSAGGRTAARAPAACDDDGPAGDSYGIRMQRRDNVSTESKQHAVATGEELLLLNSELDWIAWSVERDSSKGETWLRSCIPSVKTVRTSSSDMDSVTV